jgi:tRNA pseudouridine55 synthase
VVLLGQATRVSEYLMDLPKTYRATVRPGETTTTYDAEGEVTSRAEVDVSRAELDDALTHFVGDIEQVPPAFSALKVGGERAYKLARKGKAPELKARKVTVYAARVLSFDGTDAVIEVECGRGTYIRSLAHDLGQVLGCGAHLSALTRTRIGRFAIEEALAMDDMERRLAHGTWEEAVAPIETALGSLPKVTFNAEDEGRLRHGLQVSGTVEGGPGGKEARGVAVNGELIGIVAWDGESGSWRPRKIFERAAGV